MKKKTLLFLSILSLGFISSSYAFNMNPIKRPYSILTFFRHSYLMDKVSESAHEEITLVAYDCYTNPKSCRGVPTDIDRTSMKKTMGKLIDGVEWNDDPSKFLLRNIFTARQWIIWMDDGQDISACHRENKSNCKNIDTSYDLLYRSHYGDLQFLHGMASTMGELPSATMYKMMNWAEFTYKISTGEIQPYVALDTLDRTQVTNINQIIQRGSWTASYLFTRSEIAPRQEVKLLALGSLLHMIQDSYSDSHVNRLNSCNSLNHNKPEILEFHNYMYQDSNEHKKADSKPQWLNYGDLSDMNPVYASALIINASFNNRPWLEVKELLEKEIIKLSNEAKPANSGDPSCFSS